MIIGRLIADDPPGPGLGLGQGLQREDVRQ